MDTILYEHINRVLKVQCTIDRNVYLRGIKVSDEELDGVHIIRNDFCGNWNYTI